MREPKAQKKARLIKLLHIAKNQLMLGDAAYRRLLSNISGGKTSSTKLSLEELELALRGMKAQGFVVTTKAQAESGRRDIPVREAADGMDAQIKKIRALWLELHRLGAVRSLSEFSLARFVSRMTGVDYQGWLSVDDASRIIEHLKKWKQRVTREGAGT